MFVQLNRHAGSPTLGAVIHRQTRIMPPPPPSPTEPVVDRVKLATLPYSVSTGFSYCFFERRGDSASLSRDAPSAFCSTGPPVVAANERILAHRRAPSMSYVWRSVQTAYARCTRQEKLSTTGRRAFYSAGRRLRTDGAFRGTSSR